ncbi:AsnC family transcriptional regulator [Methylobacterium sp. NEAU 140]|uniref:AsnC family transcriptional regulator n=1 Tax=Methylobacterium sp. NEAU 140 TaxID=3064945 RepID=UPI00273453E6|nr:AsnC family transcriptional regulator [Methylobacterium sp. NEAU 140]MDP4021232.1 AsnC family transcriptional regulator [Methylobacterium sp. NEAU 140]
MLFEYTRRRGARSPVTDAPTFRVGRLAKAATADRAGTDLSHLIDRSYNYHSPRELHWHLADRLGLAPGAVTLRETAAA